MKIFSPLLVLLSLLLVINCKDCEETDGDDIQAKNRTDCMGRQTANESTTCCYYSGEWLVDDEFESYCAEFSKDEVVKKREEIEKQLKNGTYWTGNGTIDRDEVITNLTDFYCQIDQTNQTAYRNAQNYISIGLLSSLSLITLLF